MIAIIILIMFFTIPLALAVTRENGCNSGETEMFSLYDEENSHIAKPGFFNYSVCYPEPIEINLTEGNCTGNQFFVLSQYKINDSHVSAEKSFYNYSLCASVECTITSEVCPRDYHMASLNKLNNSHLGNYSEYQYKLCCGPITRTTLGSPPTPPPKPKIIVEAVEVVKKITPPILLLIGFFIFLIYWRRKKKEKPKDESYLGTGKINRVKI